MHLIVYIQKIKAVLEVSKIHYRPCTDFNALGAMCVKNFEDGVCGFTQHYIQSTVTHFTHVKGVKCVKYYVLYSVYRGPSLLQEGRLFEKPSILWI